MSRASADLLHQLRLQVSVYHNARVCGNWFIREHAPGQTCFHLVTEGSCRLQLPDTPDAHLHAGDLLLFPRETAHSLTPVSRLAGDQVHLPYHQAHGRDGTGLLCAEVRFRHPAASAMLDALPPVWLIRSGETNWLAPLTELILSTSKEVRPLADALIERFCEILFLEALGWYLAQQPRQQGLFALYSHPRIGRALNAMHDRPAHSWTLDELAGEAAMSRSAFARTFRELSGWTPMQYLGWWRMQLAYAWLSAGTPVMNVAAQAGYRSQAAFSRAFQRTFGMGAGMVRRSSRRSETAAAESCNDSPMTHGSTQ